uniref:Ovule protein n=1 Tax=Haemonchus placei TaxID=6290 RepID=A0A0N4X9J9_HAEPC
LRLPSRRDYQRYRLIHRPRLDTSASQTCSAGARTRNTRRTVLKYRYNTIKTEFTNWGKTNKKHIDHQYIRVTC